MEEELAYIKSLGDISYEIKQQKLALFREKKRQEKEEAKIKVAAGKKDAPVATTNTTASEEIDTDLQLEDGSLEFVPGTNVLKNKPEDKIVIKEEIKNGKPDFTSVSELDLSKIEVPRQEMGSFQLDEINKKVKDNLNKLDEAFNSTDAIVDQKGIELDAKTDNEISNLINKNMPSTGIDYSNEQDVKDYNIKLQNEYFKTNPDVVNIVESITKSPGSLKKLENLKKKYKLDYYSGSPAIFQNQVKKLENEYNEYLDPLFEKNEALNNIATRFGLRLNDLQAPLVQKSKAMQIRIDEAKQSLFGAEDNAIQNLGFGLNSDKLLSVMSGAESPTVRGLENLLGYEPFELSDSARQGLQMLSQDKFGVGAAMIQFSEDNKALKLWETEGPKGKKRLALDGDNTEVVYNPQSGLISPTSGYVQYTGDSYKTTLGEAKAKEQERLNKNYSVVLEKQSQILEEEIANGNFTSEKFTDWWSAVKEGDYKKALRFIPKELLKQIPYMASNYFTAGFGTVVTEGGNMYQDILKTEAANYLNKEEKDITGNDMLSYIDKFGDEGFEKAMAGGVLISAVEAAGINLMVAKGKYMRNALKEILEKDFKQAMKQVGNNTLRAGGAATGEAVTEGIQTGVNQSVVGKFDYKEYIESTGSGFLMGGLLPTGGAMISQSINTINDIGKSILLSDADTKANLKQINQYFKSAEQKIDNDFKAGKITAEQKFEGIENLSITRNTASKIPKNFDLESREKIFDLIKEKTEIEKDIKGKDDSLVISEIERINEIKAELQDIVVKDKTAKIDAGAKAVAEQLEVGIETFDTTEDTAGAIETLKNQGGKVDVKNSTDYGTIVEIPNGQGGIDTQIIINKQEAAADNVVTTSQHEVLHAVLSKTTKGNPDATIALGKSLLNELRSDGVNLGGEFEARLDQYVKDPNISEADVMEEVMTLASEGLTNGEITINESTLTKIGNAIKEFFGLNDLNIKFNTGKDVLNFIKDYNKSVQKGKGLTKGQLEVATEGAKGKLIDNAEVEAKTIVTKQSKKLPAETETYMELDNDMLQQGLNDAIQNKTDQRFPIAQAVVEKNWPLISKSLDINSQQEMDAAKEVVIDQVLGQFEGSGQGKYSPRNTSALAGFSLEGGAQVSTYLAETIKRRKPEIDVAIKERTGSSAELNTNKSEEVASVTTETLKPKAKKSPKGDAVYSSVLAENLGSDVATAVNAAIETDLLDMNVGDRFGNTKNIGPKLGEVLGKMFGLDSRVFTDKSWNIKQGDLAGLTNLKQYLNSNAINDFKLLPDAYNSKGKSNFIPDNILNKLYTKDGKNKWKKDPSKTITDYKALLGEMVKPVYRAAEATTVKGLAGLSFRNKIFETAVPDALDRVDTGVKFSKKRRNELIKKAGQKVLDNTKAEDVAFFIDTVVNIMPKYFPIANFFNSNNFASRNDIVGRGQFITGKQRAELIIDALVNEGDFSQEDINKVKVAVGVKSFFITKNGKKQSPDYGGDKYQQKVKDNYDGLELILQGMANMVQDYPQSISVVNAIFDGASGNSGHFIRQAAIPRGQDQGFIDAGFKGEKEHVWQQNEAGLDMLDAIKNNTVSTLMPYIRDNYFMIGLSNVNNNKLSDVSGQYGKPFNFGDKLPQNIADSIKEGIKKGDMSEVLSIWGRYFNESVNNVNGGIDPNTLTFDGKSVAEIQNVNNVSKASKKNPNINHAQQGLISEQITKDIDSKTAANRLKAYEPIASLEFKASKNNTIKFGDKVNNEMTVADQLTMLGVYDKAASVARKLDTPKKGISVFDFDDTLAKTKEKVIVNNSDGTTTEINAAQFAEQASDLEAEGATFDFSNFDNVVNAKKGPLADLALKRQDKFGSKDIFVLTARPQIAAEGIKKFLDGIGLNLPLANITGLENGTPGAKGNWVAGKAAEGYNDFYFADDAYKNVQAVQEVLSQIDVNSVVQVAKSSKKITFDKIFNDILESSTDIKSYKEFSAARAQTIGANKGKFTFFNTPSAEDFTGLLYKTLGKGKVGDAQMAFYKTNLLDTYNRAELAVTKAKITAANDFKALKRNLKTLPKSLSKKTGIGGFTFSQASRVAAWTRQGMNIPGLSKRDVKELNDFVDNNAELNTFVDELIKIQKGKPYPKPGKSWLGGTITSDILNEINKVNRKAYLQEWQENVDIIFSDKNMNKLEAAYGPNYVEALRDQLARMKSGSNRPIGGSRVVNNVLDWLNNSVGAVMFLNTRSAVLQTLSSVNFINFGNNNIYKAGKAFANQPQFWKDFKTLINSPYLVERRNGLKINVSESEIADAVAEASNKPKAAISYLLNKGFIFTRIADSFAIAAGGSTFYRNQLDAYVKDGMDIKEAEKRAFDDFYAIAEENQQSSNPSKISQQQASGAGRVILAFANTPMQYARIIKRSSQDLINNRGDWKSNVSKIVYYAAIQNIAFNALQSALFADAFGEEEDDEKQDKTGRIANGMADSLLRGLGIQGAAVSALKNSLITIANENDKKSPKFVKAVYDLFDFSPPIDSKFRKLRSGANTITWERENIKNKGFSLNNPAYLAGAQIISGLTNIPMDRAIQKINNIRAITSNSSQNWQKVAMALGWSTWDVGLPYYGVDDKVEMTPEMILKEKVIVMKKETSTKQQKETLLKLGLTKQQIKALKYEEARVKKIIELQEKKDGKN